MVYAERTKAGPGASGEATEREMTAAARAKLIAQALIAIGEGKSKPVPMECLSEHDTEQRHHMVQAQKLKR